MFSTNFLKERDRSKLDGRYVEIEHDLQTGTTKDEIHYEGMWPWVKDTCRLKVKVREMAMKEEVRLSIHKEIRSGPEAVIVERVAVREAN